MKKENSKHCFTCLVLAVVLLTACSVREEKELLPATDHVSSLEIVMETGQETQEDEKAGNNDKESGQEATQEERISQALSALEWEKKAVYLPEVQQKLDDTGVFYCGSYNRSGERIDMTLSDGTKMLFLSSGNLERDSSKYELMMCGDWFNENGFQENYLKYSDIAVDGDYYPETKSGKLNPNNPADTFENPNQTNLSIARNEIFARHKRKFQDPFLQAVFQIKSWYQPLYDGEEFSKKQSDLLSETEQQNLGIIIDMEQDYGYRLPDGADYQLPECIVSGSWLDLDGDGTTEKITYEVYDEDDLGTESYKLTVDGQETTDIGINLYRNLYTASLDGEGVQLLAATSGASADFAMNVYSYEDGKLKSNGILRGAPESVYISDKQFSTTFQHDYFQTFSTRETYELLNDSIVRIDQGWYEYGNEAKAIVTIPLYKEQGGEEPGIVLQTGDDVIILGTDYKEWVAIEKKSTGEKGWLKCEQMESSADVWGYTCVLPDGRKAESYDLFEGLIFYG